MKLTMGGLIQVDDHKWAVWTGGKPKADWSSLTNSATEHDKTLFQCQFTKDTTAFEARCAGLSHRFSKCGNLNQFMKDILETLEIRGLDVISYFPDPADTTKMQNVMTEHTHFSSDYVSPTAAVQKMLYDQYDIHNDMAAIHLFKNSLSSKLLQQVKNHLKPDICFLQAWMVLIIMVQTDSLNKYEKLKHTIKSHTPFCMLARTFRIWHRQRVKAVMTWLLLDTTTKH